jgi:hypothetical protein
MGCRAGPQAMEHQNTITYQRRVSSAEKLATIVTVTSLILSTFATILSEQPKLEQLVLAWWPRAQLLEPQELKNGPELAHPQMTSVLNAVRQGTGRQVFGT